MSIAYRALAALGVSAALCAAPAALAETSSPAYWAEPRPAPSAVRAALNVAPRQIGPRGGLAGVDVQQIDTRAAMAPKSVRSWFVSWNLRRYCHRDGEFNAFCRRMLSSPETAASGNAPRRTSGELAALGLKDAGAVPIPFAPPPPYLPHRPGWLHPGLEPSLPANALAVRLCNGVCEQFAGIVQSTRGGGIDNAAIYQWGPNSALTVQSASGTGINSALTGQWGACNRALVAQAASSASNLSAVSQTGYKNTALVNQH